jgi:O-antigen/teichoic acid export membrane protein
MFAATAFAVGSQWVVILSVARKDGAVGLGELSVAQAYVICVSYVAWLALRNHYLVASETGTEFSDYLFLRMAFPVLLYALAMLILILSNHDIRAISVAFGLFALKYSEGFSDISAAVLQKADASRLIAVGASLRFGASVGIFVPIYLFLHSIQLGLFALGVGWLLLFLLIENRYRDRVILLDSSLITFDKTVTERRWHLFVTTLPLGASSAVMILTNYLPRLGLNSLLGLEEVGKFTAIQNFLTLGATFVAIVGQVLLPTLAAYVKENKLYLFARLLGIFSLLTAFGCVCAWILAHIAGDQLLSFIYGPNFESGGIVLEKAIPSMFIIVFSSIMASGATAFNLYRTIFTAYAVGALVVAGATWTLVPMSHALGAFYALALGSLTQIVIFLSGIVFLAVAKQKYKQSDR